MTLAAQTGSAQPSPPQPDWVPSCMYPTLRCYCKTESVQIIYRAPRGAGMEGTESAAQQN